MIVINLVVLIEIKRNFLPDMVFTCLADSSHFLIPHCGVETGSSAEGVSCDIAAGGSGSFYAEEKKIKEGFMQKKIMQNEEDYAIRVYARDSAEIQRVVGFEDSVGVWVLSCSSIVYAGFEGVYAKRVLKASVWQGYASLGHVS